jgi:disulfide bond formation protein DsbB
VKFGEPFCYVICQRELVGEGGRRFLLSIEVGRGGLAYVAWVVALLAMVGSLFFSEVMGLPPCVLCWYQRIAMYPLVLIIATGILARDGRMRAYALPLCLVGLGVAVYHNLLYYGVIPETLTPCSEGASCTERQIEWLGFVTIPLMGLASFVTVALCLFFYRPETESE